MLPARIQVSPQERAYYDTLFSMASPDVAGYVSGKSGAQFLSHTGLPRDVLHTIWSLADIHQQGKLDREGFYVAARLVAHAQSGKPLDQNIVNIEPQMLPMFEGLKKPQQQDFDTISVGNESSAPNQFIDPAQAVTIANSLSKLGMDPLDFVRDLDWAQRTKPLTKLEAKRALDAALARREETVRAARAASERLWAQREARRLAVAAQARPTPPFLRG